MRTLTLAALVAALAAGFPGPAAAQPARLRFLASVYADDKGVGLQRPEGVACGADGLVVVSDTGRGRLLRFTYRDRTVSGGGEIRIPELAAPSRLHLGSKGQIYVLDSIRHRIVRLSPDGAFAGALSFDGAPPPETIVPKSFAIDAADRVYVLDAFGGRVLVADAEGRFERALALPADAGFVTDLAVDTGGSLVLLDSIRRRLYAAAAGEGAFGPLGRDLTASLATAPTALTIDRGLIFILEGRGSRVVTVGRDGSFLSAQLARGWTEGLLNYPSQMCVNDRSEVFVADRDNSRIQVFALAR
jgi:hypothetical protein